MTDADPTMVRPHAEITKAISSNLGLRMALSLANYSAYEANLADLSDSIANSVTRRLRELGAFNDQFYAAVRAEEKAK